MSQCVTQEDDREGWYPGSDNLSWERWGLHWLAREPCGGGLLHALGQLASKAPPLGSAAAEILREPGKADRMAELGSLQLLPRGRAAVGGTSEHAVGAGPGAGEADGAAAAEAQPGGAGAAPRARGPCRDRREVRSRWLCLVACNLSRHSDKNRKTLSPFLSYSK